MVTFTCQNCNSCLKKKAVETHLYKCKNAQLTCIDCLKDFDSKSYVGHITCVTEDERYGGQDFIPSAGKQKQVQWLQCITKVVKSNKLYQQPTLKEIIKYASDYPTCPRNKKKFINFILNNKTFSDARALAEHAFNLLSEEFNNSYENSKNTENNVIGEGSEISKETERTGGKRKKISETELQEEKISNGDSEQSTDKVSRKKNKKNNGEKPQENGDVTNGNVEGGETSQKKNKKKNKHNNTSGVDPIQNGEDCVIVSDSSQNKKKKKNKDKHRKHSINQENNDGEKEDQINSSVLDEPSSNLKGDNNEDEVIYVPDDESVDKLSKKEKKKLLKMKKYKAEIESIENYKKPEENEEEPENGTNSVVDVEKRKKKKKKHIEEEARQQKNSISEPDDKKIRLEDEKEEEEVEVVIEKPKKFKWDEVIVEVLQSQGDGEMSLKRLSKKVCSEYASILGEPKSWEDVLLKFNKKVLRTPGVRVLKDKAKLISEL